MTDIFIDSDMISANRPLSENVTPKRFAITTNIISALRTGDQSGILLVNSEPDVYNTWFPVYSTINHFYDFKARRYKDLILEFQDQIRKKSEIDRLSVSKKKFSNTFDCGEIKVDHLPNDEYWLKYSKSSNVWTIYFFEFFIITYIEHTARIKAFIDAKTVILPLSSSTIRKVTKQGEFKNLPVVSNVIQLLNKELIVEKMINTSIPLN